MPNSWTQTAHTKVRRSFSSFDNSDSDVSLDSSIKYLISYHDLQSRPIPRSHLCFMRHLNFDRQQNDILGQCDIRTISNKLSHMYKTVRCTFVD